MTGERRRDEGREIRLEGAGLLLATLGLVVLLIGAFQVGRWFERGEGGADGFLTSSGPGGGSSSDGFRPHGDVEQDPVDLEQEADVFDRMGDERAEPRREATRRQASPRDERDANRQSAVEVTPSRDGRYWVQVFAGRDEDGAAQVVDRLQGAGFPVRIFRDRDGRSVLYKVRVGGYGDAASARDAAGRLQTAGFPGAWVTETDGTL